MRRADGSIVKHGDGYRVFARITYADGTTARPSKVVHGSRKDAERALRELQSMDGGVRPITIGDMCEAYLEDCRARNRRGELESSTLRGYESNVSCHISEIFHLPVDCQPSRIRAFLDSLESNRGSVYRTLRQVYRWAMLGELVASNPLDHVKSPPTRPSSVRNEDVYSAEECAAILSCEMPDNLRVALSVAIGCGLRRGEICALEWSDYDGERISVTKSYGKDRPKTPNGVRTVAVPAFAREALDSHRGDGPMVGLMPDSLTRLWTRFLKRNPHIRPLPLKNLRHTSLSLAHKAGTDLLTLSRVAGHSSVYVTDRFYARPDQETLDSVALRMDGVISAALGSAAPRRPPASCAPPDAAGSSR